MWGQHIVLYIHGIGCLYLFPCLYPLKVKACCFDYTSACLSGLSVFDSELVGFLTYCWWEEGLKVLTILFGPLEIYFQFEQVLLIDRARASAHGAMGRQIDPSWWTYLVFLFPASAPRLV